MRGLSNRLAFTGSTFKIVAVLSPDERRKYVRDEVNDSRSMISAAVCANALVETAVTPKTIRTPRL